MLSGQFVCSAFLLSHVCVCAPCRLVIGTNRGFALINTETNACLSILSTLTSFLCESHSACLVLLSCIHSAQHTFTTEIMT